MSRATIVVIAAIAVAAPFFAMAQGKPPPPSDFELQVAWCHGAATPLMVLETIEVSQTCGQPNSAQCAENQQVVDLAQRVMTRTWEYLKAKGLTHSLLAASDFGKKDMATVLGECVASGTMQECLAKPDTANVMTRFGNCGALMARLPF